MFFEVHRGYVGLGATTVFRTAQQAARDIDAFGNELGPMGPQAGLTSMQNVFKYSTAKGRLTDLNVAVTELDTKMMALQAQINDKIKQLEGLGVMKAGDYAKMAGQLVVSYFLPFVGMGWGMFGGGGKKKQIEKLTNELNALIEQSNFFMHRIDQLNAEGKTLATSFDEGASSLSTKLVDVATMDRDTSQRAEIKALMKAEENKQDLTTTLIQHRKLQRTDAAAPMAYGMKLFETDRKSVV